MWRNEFFFLTDAVSHNSTDELEELKKKKNQRAGRESLEQDPAP